jgi:hypothetical protein
MVCDELFLDPIKHRFRVSSLLDHGAASSADSIVSYYGMPIRGSESIHATSLTFTEISRAGCPVFDAWLRRFKSAG